MLRKLRDALQPPTPPAAGSTPTGQPTPVILPGGIEVGVVGESHYQDALTAIAGGKRPDGANLQTQAALVFEPTNPYDPDAVAVYVDGHKVGYLPRPAAQAYGPVGRQLAAQQQYGVCRAVIVGGWVREDGDTGHFGVTLDLAHPDELL
jgi:HIRAN domain